MHSTTGPSLGWTEHMEIHTNIFKAELSGNTTYRISWLDLCPGGRFRNTCTQQAGGRSGKQGYTETPGLTQQLKVLSSLLPNSPMLMFASSCIRCQIFLTGVLNQVRIGACEKIAGICSDPDGRVDSSLGKLFSKPPNSKSEHTHICHSVGIL